MEESQADDGSVKSRSLGYIGFQNHGQPVWFKDVKIRVME
jgi:hypothetical protein